MIGRKISSGLSPKTTDISGLDLFEISEYQSPGYTSKKSVFDEWIDHPFNSGDYTASGGTLTANIPDETRNRYKVVGKTMHWVVVLPCQIGSAPSSLFIKIPGGHSAKSKVKIFNTLVESDLFTAVTILGGSDATKLELKTISGTDFTNSSSTNIYFSLSFEII